ncbi:MAG: hypothetical protein VX938_05350, partial [Myxococcota bacterium]|nr:hypothetical protein [Myxococcota bacterium]
LDDGVDCTTDACDEDGDAVTNTPDDAQCDNGLFCDGEETCDAVDGCENGTPPSVDDGVECTTDACDEDGDAVTNTPDDAQCDDGVECTVDSCDPINGCQFTPADGGCDDGVECTIDSCDPILGCTSVPDDGLCDDGLDCTTDTCVVGLGCQSSVPNPPAAGCCSSDDQCVTEGQCTYGYCETGTHTCVSAQDVTSFGCVQGNCSGPAQCDDGDPCTFDSCDNGEGAVGQCIPPLNLGPCISDVSCDPDAEDGGVADCDDDNPCTVDSCDGASSLCRNTPLPTHATLDSGALPCGQEGMYCFDGECEVGCGGAYMHIDEEFGDADDQADIGGEGQTSWTEHLQGAPRHWVLTQGLPSGQHPEPNALTFQVFDTDIGDETLSVLELAAGSILSKRPSEGTMADFDGTMEVRVTAQTPGAADPHLSLQCWTPLGPGQGPDTDTGALLEIEVPVSQPARVVQGAFSETSTSPAALDIGEWHYLRVRRHSYDGTVSAWLGDEELFSNAGPEGAGPVDECYLYLAAVGVDIQVNEVLAAVGSESTDSVGTADTLDCTSPDPDLPPFLDPSSGQCRYDDSDPDYGPYFCQ